jgi:hypothetical protein
LNSIKKKTGLGLLAGVMLALVMQFTVFAANITVTVSSCLISGTNVTITAVASSIPESSDGVYYLFELKPYETSVGTRKDYCAVATAGYSAVFTTPLDYNSASSKLYSRFVVTVLQNGKYVQVSNEMYITNPEALATKATSYPVSSKKGLTADWRYADELSDLGTGYASYELDVSRFFTAGGINYVYNGKTYSFNSTVVAEYDIVCSKFASEGVNVIMVIKNSYNKSTLDMIAPTGRVSGKSCYAFNVDEKNPTEKLEALMSFLANRYSGSMGTIHTWVIGNEVNSSNPWHYMGNVSAETLAAHYAREFRVCYNAIKSQNSGARVFINIDQRWNWADGTTGQFAARTILDYFAAYTSVGGNIDWGLSFHPYPVPMYNTAFWTMPTSYAGMNLIDHTDDSKFVNPTNVDVVTNHMLTSTMLSPSGSVRHILITELGLASYSSKLATDELTQAAAMVYAYKLTSSNPYIEGIVFHRQVDHASEIKNDGMALGIRSETGTKYSYYVFANMDKGNTFQYTDFALPIIGASSWAQLGLQ